MNTIKEKTDAFYDEFERMTQRLLQMEKAYRSEIAELPKGCLVKKTMHSWEAVALQFMEGGKKQFIYLPEEEVNTYTQALDRRKRLLASLEEAQICARHLKALCLRMGWPFSPEAAEIVGRDRSYYSALPYQQRLPAAPSEEWYASLPVIYNLPPYRPEGLIHRTARGEKVRSKFELVVANFLYAHGIEYCYELPLQIGGRIVRTDFVLRSPVDGSPVILECVGMLQNPNYRRDWLDKLLHYAANGYLEWDNFLIVHDDPQRGFDSARLHKTLQLQWGDAFPSSDRSRLRSHDTI